MSRYPERPVVFMSVCHLVQSIVYLAVSGVEGGLSCAPKDEEYASYVSVDGLESGPCTLSFLLLFYSSTSGALWWLVLASSWYLSAARNWTSEALLGLASYFHLVAWALPPVPALLALIMHR